MTEPGNKERRRSRQTKDRVLQARIPRQLDDELREHAEQLGLSVSTVVRNVLLNTFELVEGVVADSANIARVIQGRKPRALPHRPDPPAEIEEDTEPGIIGWQEAVLNLNGICDQCNTILHKGERAAVGVPVQARPVLLCPECLATMAATTVDKPTSPGDELDN
jgi:hypothetical protein